MFPRWIPLGLLISTVAVAQRNETARHSDPRVTYGAGEWTVDRLADGSLPFLEGCTQGIKQTRDIGAFVEFVFNGTAVYFNMVIYRGERGMYSVHLDGHFVQEINGTTASGADGLYCATVFSYPGLTFGLHKLRVTNLRRLNESEPSLLNVDSFTYTVANATETRTADTPVNTSPRSSTSQSPRRMIVGFCVGMAILGAALVTALFFLWKGNKTPKVKYEAVALREKPYDAFQSLVHTPSITGARHAESSPHLNARPASVAASNVPRSSTFETRPSVTSSRATSQRADSNGQSNLGHASVPVLTINTSLGPHSAPPLHPSNGGLQANQPEPPQHAPTLSTVMELPTPISPAVLSDNCIPPPPSPSGVVVVPTIIESPVRPLPCQSSTPDATPLSAYDVSRVAVEVLRVLRASDGSFSSPVSTNMDLLSPEDTSNMIRLGSMLRESQGSGSSFTAEGSTRDDRQPNRISSPEPMLPEEEAPSAQASHDDK